MATRSIGDGAAFERDVPVTMSDGAQLMVNVFRSVGSGPWPVVISVTPYGKDALPDRIRMTLMRISRVRFGTLRRCVGPASKHPIR